MTAHSKSRRTWYAVRLTLTAGALAVLAGCTPLRDYVRNGFKVGPNYARPPAPVADHWIDADDVRVRSVPTDDSHWWQVFNDPVLDALVRTAYEQNLTLKEAGYRVLERRALLGIATGRLFPQEQFMNGSYNRVALSTQVANRQFIAEAFYNQWNYGFGLAWELDFWGRFRRTIEAARAELNASVEDYDQVLVTLVADVASEYVTLRTLQQRLVYARQNVALQRESLKIAQARFKSGQASEVDVNQAQSDVSTTESRVEELEILHREANNRLCVLLGIPPEELRPSLGERPIPTAPPEVALGIPADLLRRRPDVRRVERQLAAQCARIGVADSLLYPHLSITGSFGWSAQEFADLFTSQAFRGIFAPGFNWNLFNYGRLLNLVRAEDARFQELVAKYQNTVLTANAEVEDGIVNFLRAQRKARLLREAADAELRAVREAITQYRNGLVDFNRVALIQERLVQRQDLLAQAEGEVAQGLIQIYRALGGGWQMRCDGLPMPSEPAPSPRREELPLPQPLPQQPGDTKPS
ncbi:MAG: efflux transporter outer membrane subunit [Gemmataceae bacterium]|nr:efflux transporter outer membrane subunit [Gemmataceae bacterium]MDW8264587.1 efflux transporter outer membrane subunit [Gemmataceae bacterium]